VDFLKKEDGYVVPMGSCLKVTQGGSL